MLRLLTVVGMMVAIGAPWGEIVTFLVVLQVFMC